MACEHCRDRAGEAVNSLQTAYAADRRERTLPKLVAFEAEMARQQACQQDMQIAEDAA